MEHIVSTKQRDSLLSPNVQTVERLRAALLHS